MGRCVTVVVVLMASAAAALASEVWRWKKKCLQLQSKLIETEASLEVAQKQRLEERTGRIRAQRDLRKNLVTDKLNSELPTAFPMTPIGHIRSCFSTRNGTPRQPLLVTLAKSILILSPNGVSSAALDGLEQYSHCWLIYVFHENTDLPSLWKQPNHRDFKAKVRVPRLDGGKLGVFATRSPHRPCPIGLTVAKVEQVAGRNLLLSGADLVDGTPVLDIKPYLPYCDSVPEASAPSWVKAGGADDPLVLASVQFTQASISDLNDCWERMGKHSLYRSLQELLDFIKQALSRDIRSLSQRQKPHNGVLSEVAEPLYGPNGPALEAITDEDTMDDPTTNLVTENGKLVLYHVILEGLKISYALDVEGNVSVRSASISHPLTNPFLSADDATRT